MGSIVGVDGVYGLPQRARTDSLALSPLPSKMPSLFLTLSPGIEGCDEFTRGTEFVDHSPLYGAHAAEC